jgi:hypothetical protein
MVSAAKIAHYSFQFRLFVFTWWVKSISPLWVRYVVFKEIRCALVRFNLSRTLASRIPMIVPEVNRAVVLVVVRLRVGVQITAYSKRNREIRVVIELVQNIELRKVINGNIGLKDHGN